MAALTDQQRSMMSRVLSHGFRNSFVLRNGSRGTTVRALQLFLKDNGADIATDGVFGPQTKAALQAYQKTAGVNVDGVAGSKTLKAIQSAVGTVPKVASLPPVPVATKPLMTPTDLIQPAPPLPRPRPAMPAPPIPTLRRAGLGVPPVPTLAPTPAALSVPTPNLRPVPIPNLRPAMGGAPPVAAPGMPSPGLAAALTGAPAPAGPVGMPMPMAPPAGSVGGDLPVMPPAGAQSPLSAALAPPPAAAPGGGGPLSTLQLGPFGAQGWRLGAAINNVNNRMQPDGSLAPAPSPSPTPAPAPMPPAAAAQQVAGDVQWFQNRMKQQGADPATIQQKTDAFRQLATLHAMGPDTASQAQPIPASLPGGVPPAAAVPPPAAGGAPINFAQPAPAPSWVPQATRLQPLDDSLGKAAASERIRLQILQSILQGGGGGGSPAAAPAIPTQ